MLARYWITVTDVDLLIFTSCSLKRWCLCNSCVWRLKTFGCSYCSPELLKVTSLPVPRVLWLNFVSLQAEQMCYAALGNLLEIPVLMSALWRVLLLISTFSGCPVSLDLSLRCLHTGVGWHLPVIAFGVRLCFLGLVESTLEMKASSACDRSNCICRLPLVWQNVSFRVIVSFCFFTSFCI